MNEILQNAKFTLLKNGHNRVYTILNRAVYKLSKYLINFQDIRHNILVLTKAKVFRSSEALFYNATSLTTM